MCCLLTPHYAVCTLSAYFTCISSIRPLLFSPPPPPPTDVVVLEAFLCRLGRVDSVQCGFTSLPLLLSRGPQTLSSQLHLWLQSSFDCHVSPHTLDPHDLSLLVGQFATAEKTSKISKLPLCETGATHSHTHYLWQANVGIYKISVTTVWTALYINLGRHTYRLTRPPSLSIPP